MKKGQKSIILRMWVGSKTEEFSSVDSCTFFSAELTSSAYPRGIDGHEPQNSGTFDLFITTKEQANLLNVGSDCKVTITPISEPTALANSGARKAKKVAKKTVIKKEKTKAVEKTK